MDRKMCECLLGHPVLKTSPTHHWICSKCKGRLKHSDLRLSQEFTLSVEQSKTKGHQDSFWYEGTVANIYYKNRTVEIYAGGEIKIYDKNDELVHDGNKERGPGFPEFKRGLDTDYQLSQLERLGYRWENNNWFEFFWKHEDDDGSWNDIMGNTVGSYNEALEEATIILKDDNFWKDYEKEFEKQKEKKNG